MQQRLSSVLVLVAASLVVLLAIAAGLNSFFGKDGDEARPADAPKAESEKKTPHDVTPVKSGNPEIDLAFALPGSPQGIATNGQELVIGNRRDPWGVLRLVRDDDSFERSTAPS